MKTNTENQPKSLITIASLMQDAFHYTIAASRNWTYNGHESAFVGNNLEGRCSHQKWTVTLGRGFAALASRKAKAAGLKLARLPRDAAELVKWVEESYKAINNYCALLGIIAEMGEVVVGRKMEGHGEKLGRFTKFEATKVITTESGYVKVMGNVIFSGPAQAGVEYADTFSGVSLL